MEEWIPVRNTPCMAPLTNCFDSVAQHGEVLIRTNVPKWAPFSPCFDYQPKRGIFLNQFEQRFDTGWAVIGSNHKADFVSSLRVSIMVKHLPHEGVAREGTDHYVVRSSPLRHALAPSPEGRSYLHVYCVLLKHG